MLKEGRRSDQGPDQSQSAKRKSLARTYRQMIVNIVGETESLQEPDKNGKRYHTLCVRKKISLGGSLSRVRRWDSIAIHPSSLENGKGRIPPIQKKSQITRHRADAKSATGDQPPKRGG